MNNLNNGKILTKGIDSVYPMGDFVISSDINSSVILINKKTKEVMAEYGSLADTSKFCGIVNRITRHLLGIEIPVSYRVAMDTLLVLHEIEYKQNKYN